MDTREAVTKELLAGATPYQLSKRYPKKSVYRIYNELAQSGQLPELGTIVIDEGSSEPQTFIPATPSQPAGQVTAEVATKETRAETIELGPDSLPVDAVNRIRGILGITLRPKVLSCPMPELLYPSMVIAVTELGFPPMRPDDFIDTVLYQWLEACDYIPFAYMKVSEIERLANKYGVGKVEEVTKEKPPESKAEDVAEEEAVDKTTKETEEESNEETLETTESDVEVEPHKPTVGDLLKHLHIDSIKKEVENDSQE
ncbi:hypothetical protein ES703_22491 [subsurface metagenome]